MSKKVFEKYTPDPENLLYLLHDLQEASGKNYLSDETIREVSEYMNIPVNKIESSLSFYSMYSRKIRGRFVIRMCNSPACYMNGSEDLLHYLKNSLGIENYGTTADGLFTLEVSSCLGVCGVAPAMMINDEVFGNLTSEKIGEIIAGYRRKK